MQAGQREGNVAGHRMRRRRSPAFRRVAGGYWRWAGLVALWAAVLWTANVVAGRVQPEWIGHATSHLTAGIPAGWLTIWAAGLHRRGMLPPAWSGTAAPLLLTGGLALFAAGQLAEAIAARIELPLGGRLHEWSAQASIVAIFAILAGAVWLLLAALRVKVLPRWVAIPLILAVAFVLFAALGGLGRAQ